MGGLSYLARRFVAGESLDQAVPAVQKLNGDGLLATLDVLGENVSKPEAAQAAAQAYVEVLEEIARKKLQCNVSVKLTQMGLDFDERFCAENVREILLSAQKHHNFVRIDMEGSQYTERTLQIFKKLYSKYPNLGIVIQSYLHRSTQDAKELAKMGAPVRVCKGAYKEPSTLAFTNMNDVRRSFQEIVETLIDGGSKVAIATHDEKIIGWALPWVEEIGLDRDRYEFQMLYGLRRKRCRELATAGHNVRAYVPYGTHWFPYFYRRLRERKENLFFLLKGLWTD